MCGLLSQNASAESRHENTRKQYVRMVNILATANSRGDEDTARLMAILCPGYSGVAIGSFIARSTFGSWPVTAILEGGASALPGASTSLRKGSPG